MVKGDYGMNLITSSIMLPNAISSLLTSDHHVIYDRVERIYREINNSIMENSLVITLHLKKLPLVLSRFTALTGLLVRVYYTLRGSALLYMIYIWPFSSVR